MLIQDRLDMPADQRCADCQLYPRDVGDQCSACAMYQKRTGERRRSWLADNPVQKRMRFDDD